MQDETKNKHQDKSVWFEARAIIEHFEVKQINHEPITDKDLLYVNEMINDSVRCALRK
jgi:hypothetical protein